MQFKIEKFKNMPYTGKVGSTLWLVSWICFIYVYYDLTRDTDWVIKLSIAAVVLAPFLFQAQNWSRMIAMLGNAMGIILSILFFYKGYIAAATVNVILFGSAIYFLLVPTTARYFKIQSQPEAPKDAGGQ